MPMMAMFLGMLSVAAAAPCDEAAQARTEAAEALIEGLDETPALDRAAVLERARILLERTVRDAPRCKAAHALQKRADSLVAEMSEVSTEAALEQTLTDTTRIVTIYEKEGVRDPADIEALRFKIAALENRLAGDERVVALAVRAAALQVKR